MFCAIFLYGYYVVFDVVFCLVKPFASAFVGRFGGYGGEERGFIEFVGFKPFEETFSQVGILNHAPRTDNTGNVECLGWCRERHSYCGRVITYRCKYMMGVAKHGKVGMDLVADDNYAIAPGKRAYFAQYFNVPSYTYRVVRVAQ